VTAPAEECRRYEASMKSGRTSTSRTVVARKKRASGLAPRSGAAPSDWPRVFFREQLNAQDAVDQITMPVAAADLARHRRRGMASPVLGVGASGKQYRVSFENGSAEYKQDIACCHGRHSPHTNQSMCPDGGWIMCFVSCASLSLVICRSAARVDHGRQYLGCKIRVEIAHPCASVRTLSTGL